ncbi:hypothetical protein HKX48_005951 [Thoreauomyces humboldtii]|nr:hypothetical protein HKX48_005951 [Thoreauomyces humboldtii]
MSSDHEGSSSLAESVSAETTASQLRRSTRVRASTTAVPTETPSKVVKKAKVSRKKQAIAETEHESDVPQEERPVQGEEGEDSTSDADVPEGSETADGARSEGACDSDEEESEGNQRRLRAQRARNGTAYAKAARGMKTPPRKRAPKKKATTAAGADTTLFQIVMDYGDAIEPQISDWIADYTEDRIAAMVDLVNFLIESSGCSGRLEAIDFEDHDSITERLTDLQSQIEPRTHQNYPIIVKGRKTGSKFRKNFTEFWTKWVIRLRNGVLFQDDGWCFEALVVWLVAMSSSVCRPFRHTATAAVLALISGFCNMSKQIHSEWTVANRQLGAEVKRLAAGKKTPKTRALEERVEDLHNKMVKLETCMNDLFDSVFVHRYRDTDYVIRMECISELGIWIQKFPDTYLDPQYLRYLGWLLSDKNHLVRMEAVRSLSKLYAIESMVSGLRPFTERFRPRLLQMAVREKDVEVRAEAVNAITRIATAGLLEDADNVALLPLIFDEDPQIRATIAHLVKDIWTEEYLPAKIDELTAIRSEEELADIKEAWIETKCLCEMLIRFASIQNAANQKQAQERELQAKNSAGGSSSIPESQSQTQPHSLFDPALSNATLDLDGDEDDDYTEEELEERERARIDRNQFSSWITKNDVVRESVIGFGQVAAAVASLWDDFKILQNWQDMCEFLVLDVSRHESPSPERSAERSKPGTAGMQLTDDEETCLVYLINAAVARALEEPPKSTGQSKKSAQTQSDARGDVTRGLIKYIPKLMKRFSNEYVGAGRERASEIAILIRNIDVGMYLEMRMLKAYDALFDDVRKMFVKHSDREVLQECSRTLWCMTGGHAISGYGGTTEESQGASARTLYAGAIQKFEELADEVVSELASSLKEVQAANLEDREPEIDQLFILCNALRRLFHLCTIVDLGGLVNPVKMGESSQRSVVFEMLHEVLDGTLVTLHKSSDDGDSQLISNRADVLDDIVETTLKIMCNDVVWELKKAFGEAVAAQPQVPSPLVGDADENETVPPKAAIPLNEVEAEEAEVLLETYNSKVERLIPIIEAIIAGDDRAGSYNFHLGVKLAAFQEITFLYEITNGDAAIVFPTIVKTPAIDIQESGIEIVGRVVAAVTYNGRDVPQAESLEPRPTNKLTIEQIEAAREEVAKVVGDLARLVQRGLFDRRHAALLLRCYGIPTEEGSARAMMQPFGTIWDGIAEQASKSIFLVEMDQAAATVADEQSGGKLQDRLRTFKDTIQGMADLLCDGLSQSTDLYLTSKVETIDPALTLAKLLVGYLKAWLNRVKESSKLKVTHGLVVQTMLELLKQGCDHMVYRMEQWAVVHGDHENNQMEFVRPKEVRKELLEVNEAWKVWGAIGGAVQQIVHELGMLKRAADNEDTIDDVEDVVEYVSQKLLSIGHKPVETEREWAGYWSFVKALQKGDSTVRRRGRKPKVAASRDVSPAPTAGKRKRTAATKRAKSKSSGETKKPTKKRGKKHPPDEDDDDSTPATTPAPSRRSSRAAASAKKSYTEADEDEEAADAANEQAAEASDAPSDEMEDDAGEDMQSTPTARIPSSTPSATYKSRSKTTAQPNSARGLGQRNAPDEPIIAPASRPAPVAKKHSEKLEQGGSTPSNDSNLSRTAKGTKRRRSSVIESTPPPAKHAETSGRARSQARDSDHSSDEDGEGGSGELDKENVHSETGFMSSPEIVVPRKRVRL